MSIPPTCVSKSPIFQAGSPELLGKSQWIAPEVHESHEPTEGHTDSMITPLMSNLESENQPLEKGGFF